ncbi:MAG: 3-deoxy-7-phosphoheptulonate synthase class II [Solimonas sp.]
MSETTPPLWAPQSWTMRAVAQAPQYDDAQAYAETVAALAHRPPLVTLQEIRELKVQLAQVAHGAAFLLQGGDCAESFAEFSADTVRATATTLAEMARLLGEDRPVVTVGRIAGQFAKPRSSPLERVGDVELPSYRGDIINGAVFDAASRRADPRRMLRAYEQSAATLKLLRAMPVAPRLYTSHEALLLPYEAALTRRDARTGEWYAGSAHMVWIGDRTRQLDGAHVEFCRGIVNPLGVKCGPSLQPDELRRLLDRLDPRHEPGRITLIVRLGDRSVADGLPPLIRAVRDAGRPVIWSCDPMHGNTETTRAGRKTRPLRRIVDEVRAFYAVHRAAGTHAGGLHLEMTGKDVTECTGGWQRLSEDDLARRYHTACDPRLNALQALEVAQAARRAGTDAGVAPGPLPGDPLYA